MNEMGRGVYIMNIYINVIILSSFHSDRSNRSYFSRWSNLRNGNQWRRREFIHEGSDHCHLPRIGCWHFPLCHFLRGISHFTFISKI